MKATWPAISFVVCLLVLLVLFSLGGLAKVVAWYLTLSLPILGIAYLLIGLAQFIFVRRLTFSIVASVCVGLICFVPVLWLPFLDLWPMGFPADVKTTTPSLFIRVPTDQVMIVSNGGNDPRRNVHAFLPPQHWAYDLLIAPYGSGDQLTDYGCYGVPVVAPIGGAVVLVVDDVADSPPGKINMSSNPYGNHVVVEPDQGGFLVVAHLKQGSAAVEAGETVIEGEPIGQCGNSGNTTEPHVHVHYQREDPRDRRLLAEGLPLYFRDNSGSQMPNGIMRSNGGVGVPGERIQHIGLR